MTATIMTSRESKQDTSRAKRAAKYGPVFITDRGTPAQPRFTPAHRPERCRCTGNLPSARRQRLDSQTGGLRCDAPA